MANLRISGIMSGFDTDTMIKDLMKAESSRMDKVKQNRQYAVWQQEGFREIIGKLRTFQSNYFDVLKSTQNMTSPTSFAKFSYSAMSGSVASTAVSITANADVKNKSQTIESITRLASKDVWTSIDTKDADLRGIETTGFDFAAFKSSMITADKDVEFTMAIGSNSKVIKITKAELASVNPPETNPPAINNIDDLKNVLNSKIATAFGSDYNNLVSTESGNLKIDFAGSEVKILTYGTNTETMTAFGFDNGESSLGYKTKSLKDLFALTDVTLSSTVINGKNIVLSENDNIYQMMDKINASDANVTLTYDGLKDKFSLSSKMEGSASNISIISGSTAETLLKKLFNSDTVVDASGAATTDVKRSIGVNAQLSINGTTITQSNNTFTIEGMTYTLKELTAAPININVSTDTTAITDNIKNFVKEYNEIVDFINDKLKEKRDYEYRPLTDEEKEAMTEDEVKIWETRAKSGMMKGSSELSNMLTQFRNAVFEPMTNVGISMSQIGISSTGYADKGKLTIDETKLKSALENNFDDVVNLFTKESSITYSDTANKTTRYNENGITSRFEDILKDFTRTTRDSNGNKGILIVKAGIENDTSAFSNDFSKKITGFDDRIADMLEDLNVKEEYYFMMFSKMESALSQMESQSSSLMSQLGG